MEQTIILKTDRLGRVRTPRERQEEIVGAWRASGVSAMRFAETIGVKYQTLATWIRRGRQARDNTTVPCGPASCVGFPAPQWLEMTVGHVGGLPLRLELPGGASLLLADGSQIPLAAQLLRALS